MNSRRKLQNPFVLVSQGFLAGAVLFFAFSHDDGQASAPVAPEAQAQSFTSTDGR